MNVIERSYLETKKSFGKLTAKEKEEIEKKLITKEIIEFEDGILISREEYKRLLKIEMIYNGQIK